MRFVSVEVKAVYIILSSTDARGESHYCDDAASQQFTADLSMEKIKIATSQLGSWECEKTDEADKDPADRQDSGPIVRGACDCWLTPRPTITFFNLGTTLGCRDMSRRRVSRRILRLII